MFGIFALALFALTGASAAIASSPRVSSVAIVPADRTATHAFLKSDEELVKAALTHYAATDAATVRSAEALSRECKGVLAGVPDEEVIDEEVTEGGPLALHPRLSGRAQGERARSEQEKQTIEVEIDETVSASADRVLRRSYEAYFAAAGRLTWSNPTVDSAVRQKVVRLREDLAGPSVAVCAEMRAWAASGFHVLPPGSREFREAMEARNKRVAQVDLAALLRPYEGRAEREIIRRTAVLLERLREREREDEARGRAEYRMDRVLGERRSSFVEQRFAPVIAKGRTLAGATFVVRRDVGKGFRGSCRREVYVELRERNGGGSAGGVCLSEGPRPQPSASCSSSVETIEFATAPDALRVRVLLSDGRALMVAVVRVPIKDGGPGGVFVDTFHASGSYPVLAQELSRKGRVLRTVRFSRLRCTKEVAGDAPEGPEFVTLATVTTPTGEPLAIQGTLLRFRGQTEFSLGPSGMRESQSHEENEEQGTPKQFRWDFSAECAPRAYSLIDGILVAPGASVLVRIPAGLTPLTKVELPASVHAEGPLFYGIYVTPPTEIVVERSDGSVLYTESLAAKATEETEFCEGYAEQ